MCQPIDVILVPKGEEFKAVQRGVERALATFSDSQAIKIVALPVGPGPVGRFMQTWMASMSVNCDDHRPTVILMGLCGGLQSSLPVGQAVLYEHCLDGTRSQISAEIPCSTQLFSTLSNILGDRVTIVTGVTCDRVISRAAQKQQLAQTHAADVVDMEGVVALTCLRDQGYEVGMVRVVSDNARGDVPDLNHAFDAQGNLRPSKLAGQFLKQPLGALRLIRGSLKALAVLEVMAFQLQSANVRSSLGA
ncbi:5'-methylthioadenosine/S-adenosylhomocysteine nucleosidase family protein [Lyngbya confervoides]|uniref:Nucleoside phosphorylase domain-containing protein n=1 Tax=Lyngbya confervoides BDU141951 TaxID=1574623 RepID=A0ABD4T779_9CYAN|nr:hypothetical protein [Lyngbya confervoides]MCM1984147.1 hypothetical protein [Lyngbya confervoides BDU141951]